jgi:hypothetical protein
MKADAFGEIYLWSREIDRLVRVLQRMEVLSIRPKQELKAYEVRLEEIRAGLNSDFTAYFQWATKKVDPHCFCCAWIL